MTTFVLRKLLPYRVFVPLFGDRKRWGRTPDKADSSWQEWEQRNTEIYLQTQQEGLGRFINRFGYLAMHDIDLTGKRVLEIGPGRISHTQYWKGSPSEYVVADRRQAMLDQATASLNGKRCQTTAVLLDDEEGSKLPFENDSFDVVVSFYNLEHLHPLQAYLKEVERILRADGQLVGAIPTDGGIAWGLGRLLTTRRYFKKHTAIDPDKIICWEHPNFADFVLSSLDETFLREKVTFWPLSLIRSIDTNLFVRFIFKKQA